MDLFLRTCRDSYLWTDATFVSDVDVDYLHFIPFAFLQAVNLQRIRTKRSEVWKRKGRYETHTLGCDISTLASLDVCTNTRIHILNNILEVVVEVIYSFFGENMKTTCDIIYIYL